MADLVWEEQSHPKHQQDQRDGYRPEESEGISQVPADWRVWSNYKFLGVYISEDYENTAEAVFPEIAEEIRHVTGDPQEL